VQEVVSAIDAEWSGAKCKNRTFSRANATLYNWWHTRIPFAEARRIAYGSVPDEAPCWTGTWRVLMTRPRK